MSPPPHFEILIGKGVRTAFLGRPIKARQDDIDFWAGAGFCLYPVTFGLSQFGSIMTTGVQKIAHAHYSLYRDEDVDMP